MNINLLYHQLQTLAIFRGIRKTPVIRALEDLLFSIDQLDLNSQLGCYGAFASSVFQEGGDLGLIIKRLIMEDENFYVINQARGINMKPEVTTCLDAELAILQNLCQLRSQETKALIQFDGFLPDWANTQTDLKADYLLMLSTLSITGYGIFAKYNGFTVKNGELIPMRQMDTQTLDSLYGYQRERNLVLENTRALVSGGSPCNGLLYGDAGTGKGSTVKAVARHFYGQGLRLIEFKKNQLEEILPIMEFLSEIPLKFIFYIDDLSFSQNDDTFCALKGILEGSAASYAPNIAIYATSNRRHLIKESMEDRIGNQLHINDTLQETMSLAARFGLTITFSKPEKELYLEITKSMAKEYHIDLPEEELFQRAEAFAIRQNGRSPRTAKQFLQLLQIELSTSK